MRAQKILIVLLSIFVLLTACGTNTDSDNKQGSPVNTNDPNQAAIDINQQSTTDEKSNSEQTTEEPKTEEQQIEAVEENPQYYVNEKYFIKPVNSDDKSKVVLLTFDDSPAGDSTRSILDTLDKYDAKAIWFINGYYADKNRELLKDIHNRGHIIGNHTWWHENLSKIDAETTRTEIVSINDLVEEVIGVRPVYFRAPFGVYSDEAKKVLQEENMQYMNWTWGSLDWELKTAEEIEKNVIDNIHSGANILFHDKRITAEALENILKALTDEGYTFVLPTEVRVQD